MIGKYLSYMLIILLVVGCIIGAVKLEMTLTQYSDRERWDIAHIDCMNTVIHNNTSVDTPEAAKMCGDILGERP